MISTKLNQAGAYQKAFKQGTAEASTAVAAAQALGIVPGSTLWYDLEGYDVTNGPCRESSLWFLSAWTQQLHALGYVSGVYSSAGSGIKSLDDARVLRPGTVHAARPDLDRAVGRPGQHLDDLHPLRRLDAGPPDEAVPGRAQREVGRGDDQHRPQLPRPPLRTAARRRRQSHCHGTPVDLANYPRLKSPSRRHTPNPGQVAALKCLLKEQGVFHGRVKGAWTQRLTKSVKHWQRQVGLHRTAMFSRSAWMTLLSAGPTTVLNLGSSGEDVRRVQRALNAASARYKLPISGTLDAVTQAAVIAWQAKNGIAENGVVGPASWAALQAGNR